MEISVREKIKWFLSLSLGKFTFLDTKKYFKWLSLFLLGVGGSTMKNDDSASKRVWSVN